jgi:hypothetical protein
MKWITNAKAVTSKMVTDMWNYCELCSSVTLFGKLKKCEFCGNVYCERCDPKLERLVYDPVHGDELTFCSLICSDDYSHGYRRSRKRKRCDDSDSD